MTSGFSFFSLPDAARLAYEVLGYQFLGAAQPLVLIGGMTTIRSDLVRISSVLSQSRPVLVYDHRGIGDSSYSSPDNDDEITIESMARDLFHLLIHLRWQSFSICGYSMGGVIAQQLCLLPFARTNPVKFSFVITHLFLCSTRSVVLPPEHGLQYNPVPGKVYTVAERIATARRMLAESFDPEWIETHSDRFEVFFNRVIRSSASQRPPATITRQKQALKTFDLIPLLPHFPSNIKVLVIHGERDQIIPLSFGKDILNRIPHARFVEVGQGKGKLPNLAFGHAWYSYFDTEVWKDVFETHLAS